MTHEYVVLVGGRVIQGGGRPDVSAVAWAADTILALGTDDEVRSISRGDSRLVSIVGATIIPIADPLNPAWSSDGRLDVGGRADVAVLDRDPRTRGDAGSGDAGARDPGSTPRVIAVIAGGRVVRGELPEAVPHEAGATTEADETLRPPGASQGLRRAGG